MKTSGFKYCITNSNLSLGLPFLIILIILIMLISLPTSGLKFSVFLKRCQVFLLLVNIIFFKHQHFYPFYWKYWAQNRNWRILTTHHSFRQSWRPTQLLFIIPPWLYVLILSQIISPAIQIPKTTKTITNTICAVMPRNFSIFTAP